MHNSIISTPSKTYDHVENWINSDDDVVLNCTSSMGDTAGDSVAFGTTGAALQNTILDGGFDGDDAVPFVTFPTTKAGVGINDGTETFNGEDGAAVGMKEVEFPGVAVVGGEVGVGIGAVVGTTAPTIALQVGESKVAQMGVNDA